MTDLQTPQPAAPQRKSWPRRHKILTGIGVLVLLGALGTACGGPDASNSDSTPAAASPSPDVSTVAPTQAPPTQAPSPVAQPIDNTTVSQQNAVRAAQDYLGLMSFSRTGLIEQLKFSDYSTADATFAVDHLKANWNQEAAKKAAEYLGTMPFSHGGMVQQLEFDGFTPAQAEYGAKQAGL